MRCVVPTEGDLNACCYEVMMRGAGRTCACAGMRRACPVVLAACLHSDGASSCLRVTCHASHHSTSSSSSFRHMSHHTICHTSHHLSPDDTEICAIPEGLSLAAGGGGVSTAAAESQQEYEGVESGEEEGGAPGLLASPLSPSGSTRQGLSGRKARVASVMSGNMFARPLSRNQARAMSRMSERAIEVSLDIFRAETELNRSLHTSSPLAEVLPRADPVFKTKRLGSHHPMPAYSLPPHLLICRTCSSAEAAPRSHPPRHSTVSCTSFLSSPAHSRCAALGRVSDARRMRRRRRFM